MDIAATGSSISGVGRREIRMDFGHDASAPRRARELLFELFGGRNDAFLDDVRLVTSELVSNVIQHTHDGGVLRAFDPRPGGPVRIEVEDHDSQPPPSRPVPRSHGGRGLSIVDSVCSRWGVRRLGDEGKMVWAEFDGG